MKKNLFSFVLVVMLSSISYGQIGINTDKPTSTLDVSTKKNGSILEPQPYGIQAPRLTKQELSNLPANTYGTNQEGVIIYINNVTGNNFVDSTKKITKEGYYYYNGKEWITMEGSSPAFGGWNIVGTEANGTTSSQNIYQMGRVAINTDNPIHQLDVNGTMKIKNLTNGDASVVNDDFGLYNQNANSWMRFAVKGSDNNENGKSAIAFYTTATEAKPNGGSGTAAMMIAGGRVGIGTNNPDTNYKLNVIGNSRFNDKIVTGKNLSIEGDTGVDSKYLLSLQVAKSGTTYGRMDTDRGMRFHENGNNVAEITAGLVGASNLNIPNDDSNRYLSFKVRNTDNINSSTMIIRSYGDKSQDSRVGVGTVNPGNKLEVTSGTEGNSGLRLTNIKNAESLATNENGDIVAISSNKMNVTLAANQSTNSINLKSGGESSAVVRILDSCGQRISFKLFVTGEGSNWGFDYDSGTVASKGTAITTITSQKISNKEMKITTTGLLCSSGGYNGTVNFTAKVEDGKLVITNS
ncbi:hypothetical protein HX096_06305 [Empedobacter falsenii]|uniref:hypothetical protein n=1 Tax=Empedobacter falsenii TaxID=343874 RepID=UPI002578B3F4|nr:hypothetical protein [Empedobacter falsenii]MDM1547473.1 hypothetical protein [Empedobacter falsenii]